MQSFTCYSNPESNPYITESEKQYLHQEITGNRSKLNLCPPTPWRQIFSSPPVWAFLTATIHYDWSQLRIMIILPQIWRNIKQCSYSEGFYVCIEYSIPYLLNWLISALAGFLSDFLVNHKILSITTIRKIMTCISKYENNLVL